MTNTGNGNKKGTTQLIKTSKGRTVLDIAIEDKHVSTLQYLVTQKRVSIKSEGGKDLQALLALEAVLKAMPESPRPSLDQAGTGTGISRNSSSSAFRSREQMNRNTAQHYQRNNNERYGQQQAVAVDSRQYNKNSNRYFDDGSDSDSYGSENYDSFETGLDDSDSESDDDKVGNRLNEEERINDDESVATTVKDPVRNEECNAFTCFHS
jgi:hypothetical protein